MSKLKDTRLRLVTETMQAHGAERKDCFIATLGGLAADLNNTWKAKHFVNSKEYPSAYSSGYALNDFRLYLLFPGIKHGVKGSNIRLVMGGNHTEYLVLSKP